MYTQPNKRSGKLNCTDHFLHLCMPVNNDGDAEGACCALLTVHGEFLRGGGKRGLLSTAGLCCPLAWPPSTEKVAPMRAIPTHNRCQHINASFNISRLTQFSHFRKLKNLTLLILSSAHDYQTSPSWGQGPSSTKVLKCPCTDDELRMEEDVGSRHAAAFALSGITVCAEVLRSEKNQCLWHQRFGYIATAVRIKYSSSLKSPNIYIYRCFHVKSSLRRF